jgi:hypothetical protein
LKESKVYKELGALTKEKNRWENSITYQNDSHEWLARHADSENECWIELIRGKTVDDNRLYYLDLPRWNMSMQWNRGAL